MFSISNLSVSYGRAQAVSNVSIHVGPGEAVCIVGPNGAGKSSTMLAAAGAIPFRGEIRIDQMSIGGEPPENICRLGLAMVPEGRGIFPLLTVEENLMLGTAIRKDQSDVPGDRDRIFARFPVLHERRHSNAGKLSGGEQQQLSISRALMMRPKVLLIDEPSLGLAPKMINTVYDFLGELRLQGIAMLVVEQSIERALGFSDRLYVMREGSVRLEGPTGELRNRREALEEAYFGFTAHHHPADIG